MGMFSILQSVESLENVLPEVNTCPVNHDQLDFTSIPWFIIGNTYKSCLITFIEFFTVELFRRQRLSQPADISWLLQRHFQPALWAWQWEWEEMWDSDHLVLFRFVRRKHSRLQQQEMRGVCQWYRLSRGSTILFWIWVHQQTYVQLVLSWLNYKRIIQI